MLFKEMINEAIDILSKENIADAINDAWLIAEYSLNITKQKYYMNMQMTVDDNQYEKYMDLIQIRKSHVPLQHITGSQEFMGLVFNVNRNVLIPRQDTEVLVEKVIDILKKMDKMDHRKYKVLDMCTGSGCIAISIAKLLEKQMELEVTASDISNDALEVAKKNAALNNVNINFVESDLFENIEDKFDIIVSNPPYIPTDVIKTLDIEVKDNEPFNALDGMEDGLFFYKKITEKAFDYLNENGCIAYEIGHDQGESVSSILRKKVSCVKVYKDLAGNDRVVIAGKDEL